jgi:hypothetical protein
VSGPHRSTARRGLRAALQACAVVGRGRAGGKATVPAKKEKEKEPEKVKGKGKGKEAKEAAKEAKEAEAATPVQAAPVPTGPTANWRFQASLFNVTLAATAESALNQPSECPQCSSSQAAQNIAELAKKLLIADKSHPRGSIEISTTPGDATVFVDNVELLGKTPRARRCRSRPSRASTSCGSKRPTTSLHEQEGHRLGQLARRCSTCSFGPVPIPRKWSTFRRKWCRVRSGASASASLGIAAGAALVGFGGLACFRQRPARTLMRAARRSSQSVYATPRRWRAD